MKKLFLIDAYALIFKFYYAFLSRPMRNKEGLNTSAIFGFTKFVNDIISRECPDYLGVAFDVGGGTFRHELYPEYKANRGETPPDIIASTPHIKSILEAMGIPILEMQGYEADDIIGTISTCASKEGFEVYMVTPDKDYAQLIKPNVHMYKPSKSGNGVEIVGMDNIEQLYGVKEPALIIDILALWGDASDNIPGVMGIGEKGAIKLVNQFGNIESIVEHLSEIKGKAGQNIANSLDQLYLSKQLTTIETNVPIDFCSDKLKVEHPNYPLLKSIYQKMGFNNLISTIEFWERCHPEAAAKATTDGLVAEKEKKGEPTLFSETSNDDLGLFASMDEKQSEDLFSQQPVQDTITSTTHNYIVVEGDSEIDKLVTMLRLHKKVAFDSETTSLNCMIASLVGLSFAVEEHTAYYVPLYPKDKAKTKEILHLFDPLWNDKGIAKIGQNIKYDLLVLKNYGIEVEGTLYDTMIIHYLLDSDSRHSMDYLADKYLNYKPIEISELIGKGARQLTMDCVAKEKVAEYAAEDADVTLRLYNKLWRELQKVGQEELYLKIEEPLIKVLTQMEFNGVKVDAAILSEYSKELNGLLNDIQGQIEAFAQGEININSPRQLGVLLFEKLKIDSKPKMTKTKSYKTDEEYLLSLRDKHPIVDMILEYRSLKKLLSTYVEALPLMINPDTGRIHSSYNQAVTTTGRLSSNNPNLQNIPIRDKRGKMVRAAFIADGDDKVLISADYSQVELRIMAVMSGDESLIEAFNRGEDIHRATAATIYGVELSEVSDEQRRKAKTANFGIIYGISPFGLAQRLSISRKEASELIDSYFVHYPKVKEYMDNSISKAKEQGYCTTLYGRRKYLADITSPSAVVRGFAERNAINAPIQGTAADIIKLAMTKLHLQLTKEECNAKIIMQVHDELVVECSKDNSEKVAQIIVQSMENSAELAVKLVADCGIGHSWLEAH